MKYAVNPSYDRNVAFEPRERVFEFLQIEIRLPAGQGRLADIQQVRGVMEPSLGLQSISRYGRPYRYQPPMSVRMDMEMKF